MLNEIAEFKAYTEAPIYKRDNKNDNSFLGRFTREGIQGFEGFPRVLTTMPTDRRTPNGLYFPLQILMHISALHHFQRNDLPNLSNPVLLSVRIVTM